MLTNNHKLVALVVAMLFTVQFSIAQSPYRFQHFDTRDGLMDDFIFGIAQDSLGFMWFQHYNGLTRFDGYNFKVYKYDRKDSLRSSLDFVSGGYVVDENKNLWFQKRIPPGPPFKILRYDPRVDGFIKFTADLDLSEAQVRIGGDNRTIWLHMMNGNGLQSLDLHTKEITKYINPSTNEDVFKAQNTVFDSYNMGSSLLVATERGLWV
ncbi:MAG TPA: hypothetical protein VK589_27990, partial [Chryseolinea sp.]|nr:hypothetical protein [Chryseolinea sp.]